MFSRLPVMALGVAFFTLLGACSSSSIGDPARAAPPGAAVPRDIVLRQLLSQAGIRADALAEAWRRLAEVTEGAVLLREFHPVTPERLDAIEGSASLAPGIRSANVSPN